ncbi:MAG: hypothetical protein NTV80_18530 [Verrucomicrobia bacterium]|nr:hypothetical protein [Verrucomicrobiota bacterium]
MAATTGTLKADEFFIHGANSYQLVTTARTWDAAQADAAAKGGNLVRINDVTENTAIFNAIQAFVTTEAADGGGAACAWIGGREMTEGTYAWAANPAQPFWAGGDIGTVQNGLYENWGFNNIDAEPDNFGGTQNRAAMAVERWPADAAPGDEIGNAGQWNDIRGANTLFYIIEYAPPDFIFVSGGWINPVGLPAFATASGPVLSVTGLPLGVKYDPILGKLVGMPTIAGPGLFTARVSVRVVGGQTVVIPVAIRVEALPSWAVGSFTAILADPPIPEPFYGVGFVSLTCTGSGACTGSLTHGTKKYAFKTQLQGQTEAARGSNPLGTAQVTIVRNPNILAENITLTLKFLPQNHATAPGMTGRAGYGYGPVRLIEPGWQHVWNARVNPAFGNLNRTLNLAINNPSTTTGPQGVGFASLRLTTAGLATWSATLADGRKVIGSSTVSPDERVFLFAPIPYTNSGVFFARFRTEEDGPTGFYKVSLKDANDFARWSRMPTSNPLTLDRVYREGFDLIIGISGAEHLPPERGTLLFADPAPGQPLSLTLTGAGINTAAQLPTAGPVLISDCQLLAGNRIVVDNNAFPLTVNFVPAFNAITGLFSGTVTLSDTNPLGGLVRVPRTLTYSGLYIPDLDNPANSRIRGFFTLPELPDAVGETISNTPILSGTLNLGN